METKPLKYILFTILLLIAIFSAVELGLTADLVWEFDHRLGGISSNFRRRARYLLFCSTWTILAAVILAIVSLGASSAAAVAIAVVMFMSFMFWLLGASLFTSTLGGGLSCGQATFSGGRRLCNISNTAMAFAWINWSFITIALLLSLWLAFELHNQPKGEKATTNRPRAAAPPPANAPPPAGSTV